ncbi:MAG: alcohol dehydrogenase catalytic domain-containing protein, partial [Cyclobacteriaceae bacterium]
MKALVIASPKEYSLKEVDIPILADGQALVKMKAAALNRRDYWIGQGKYPNISWGSILGSDGCGVVTEVRDQDDKQWVDREVVIYPGVGWGDNPRVQAPDY